VAGLLAICGLCGSRFLLPQGESWWGHDKGVPAATEQPAPEVALHGLYRGDCFDIGDSADSVVPEPCAEWHDGEVLGQVTGTDQARN
jgi:hypothetical protein